jgi:hypothetical protein
LVQHCGNQYRGSSKSLKYRTTLGSKTPIAGYIFKGQVFLVWTPDSNTLVIHDADTGFMSLPVLSSVTMNLPWTGCWIYSEPEIGLHDVNPQTEPKGEVGGVPGTIPSTSYPTTFPCSYWNFITIPHFSEQVPSNAQKWLCYILFWKYHCTSLSLSVLLWEVG